MFTHGRLMEKKNGKDFHVKEGRASTRAYLLPHRHRLIVVQSCLPGILNFSIK